MLSQSVQIIFAISLVMCSPSKADAGVVGLSPIESTQGGGKDILITTSGLAAILVVFGQGTDGVGMKQIKREACIDRYMSRHHRGMSD